jgi:hypothetical protein
MDPCVGTLKPAEPLLLQVRFTNELTAKGGSAPEYDPGNVATRMA